jgi:uncharacterized protein YdaU (DUF1376 family)
MSGKLPFIAFYPSDWLGGTRGLSAHETGVYITLVCMMYEAEGAIAHADERLARACGTTVPLFRKALAVLVNGGKIIAEEGTLWNDRVERELEKREEKIENARNAARARHRKREENQGPSSADADQIPF